MRSSDQRVTFETTCTSTLGTFDHFSYGPTDETPKDSSNTVSLNVLIYVQTFFDIIQTSTVLNSPPVKFYFFLS